MTSLPRQYDFPQISIPKNLIRFLAILILLLVLVFKTIVFIPAGHAGVVYDRGSGVLAHPLKEGVNILIPFWQSVFLMDTRLQEYTMSAAVDEGALRKDDSLDAPTSDGQQVKIDASVLFRIDPSDAPYVYQSIGPNYVDKVIRPFSRSQIRMVISRYSATKVYTERRVKEVFENARKFISKLRVILEE